MSSLRTHDDTWDIATSVGSTAVMVAAARAAETARADPLIRDPYARGSGRRRRHRCLGLRAARGIRRQGRRSRRRGRRDLRAHGQLPGRAHPFLRRLLRRRRRGGHPPGRDPGVGPRLARIPAGLARRHGRYEIDQPKVLEYKAAKLAEHGASPSAKRRAVAIDLRFDWPNALREAGFDVQRADRVAGRRPADVPACRCPGPALRADQRAERARQPRRGRDDRCASRRSGASRCGRVRAHRRAVRDGGHLSTSPS